MVLEEILIIRGPIDAPEVVRAFSEAGMPARITQTVALEGLVSAKGKIRDIKALLKEENARIEELAEEFRTEEGIEETGIEEDEEETGAGRLHDNPGLNVVERIAEVIAEFMEMHKPGDVIPADGFKEWILQPVEAAPEEELAEAVPPDAVSSVLCKFLVFTSLEENDLIKIEDEGVVVLGHMDPEDIILTLPGVIVEDIHPDALKEHDIQIEMTVTAVPEHRLEFGPEAVLGADLEGIDELIDGLEIDEDEYMMFRQDVSLKQIVTTRTLEILEERGTLTPAEVAEALGSSAVADTEEGWSIVLNLTPEFVKGLLTDLKKIGLVRKKSGGFRAV
ncbi:MAG TPA: hypothetical protein PKK74_00675 [Candidatus Methanoculleus thermohydrogenotrophicum]|jgi:hypothetical protein|nr:hypothetical protein [Candidatus Methanoculleus thermohydrogenotrophicum]NLM82372.1 hypothetical protein [Candidatus Methanoculleus thermohydrogenotrophicum]HOB17198.1 hypothetical protein [Candidatus Methanoculleus thermohydrogenotrophicum]HPZ37278.1 hypothetical protein [Candidatus Methanoculleus thermohydrogenotrophicum]HQC90509.1 hypothetical protein [Candidatus Methanoculleus thermohydrogenotrophicum]